MRPTSQIPHHRSFAGSIAFGLMAGILAFSGVARATPAQDEVVSIVPLAKPQPPAQLIVEPLLAEPLSRGVAIVPYQTVNLRIVPIFGAGALAVSPRVGHIHVTVDDAPWHWADVSGQPIIVADLAPGPHKIELILADPTHQPLDRKVVAFVVPGETAGNGTHNHH